MGLGVLGFYENNETEELTKTMQLTKEEQETVVTFTKGSEMMEVYTADPVLLKRLSNLPAYELKEEYRSGGRVIAKSFTADKRLLTLRAKRSKMTEENKEKARQTLLRIKSESRITV